MKITINTFDNLSIIEVRSILTILLSTTVIKLVDKQKVKRYEMCIKNDVEVYIRKTNKGYVFDMHCK
jgi:hypothetical protein